MKFQIYQDKAGEWRWRLLASNGNIVADSGEGYTTKVACLDTIDRIKTASVSAEVVETED